MERKLSYNKIKNKKAISGIVTAVIMIALVMAAAIIVWVVVNNLVTEQLGEAESCFMIFGKVLEIGGDHATVHPTT